MYAFPDIFDALAQTFPRPQNFYFPAKWKSHVFNHFIAAIFFTLHPGYPYVNGANHKNPKIKANTIVAPTACSTC